MSGSNRHQDLPARRVICRDSRRHNGGRKPVSTRARIRQPTLRLTRGEGPRRSASLTGPRRAGRSSRDTCADRPLAAGGLSPKSAGERHYSQIMANTADMVRQLIQIVVTDPGLPRNLRRKARSLESLASSKPDLVLEELEVLRNRAIPDLVLLRPALDYARCVSVPVFWRYHLRPAQRGIFRTGELYRRYLESLNNREEVISNHLRDDEPLVPGRSLLVGTGLSDCRPGRRGNEALLADRR